MTIIYIYKCAGCEETFTKQEKSDNHRCDWFDCENDEQLEFVEVMSA